MARNLIEFPSIAADAKSTHRLDLVALVRAPFERGGLIRPSHVVSAGRLEQARRAYNAEKREKMKIAFRDVLEMIPGSTEGAGALIMLRKPPIERLGNNWMHWSTAPNILKGVAAVCEDSAVLLVTDEERHSVTFKLKGADDFTLREKTPLKSTAHFKDDIERDISRLEFALMLFGREFVDEEGPSPLPPTG